MRSKFIHGTISILVLSSAIVASPLLSRPCADDHDQDRADIRAHIESIFNAFINKDHDTLAKTHSEDWRGFMGGSRSVMRGHDAYMQVADGSIQASGGMTGFKITDYDVSFPSRDVAVINYVAEVQGKFGNQTSDTKYRTLDVYAKRKGGWIQVSTNTAIHPDIYSRQQSEKRPVTDPFRKALFDARDAVWRACFEGDRGTLEKMIPEEAVAINSSVGPWEDRASILASCEAAAKSGTKVVKLEFPKTEIQVYGSTAILYSRYLVETERGGQKHSSSGVATEVFVFRNGAFVNTGWQLNPDKGSP